VKVPTLIVWGRQDTIIPLNCGELYQQAVSNSRLHVIDRCGHSPALEKPQEFLQVIQEFLSQPNWDGRVQEGEQDEGHIRQQELWERRSP
jgi:alpha-beta hydrolase superfamily lysophospholipase